MSLLDDGVSEASRIAETHLLKAMRRGNAAGGLCIMHKGAIPAMPTREQVDIAIKEGESK